MVRLGYLFDGDSPTNPEVNPSLYGSRASDISADGTTITGHSTSKLGYLQAFRWTQVTGMVGLGALPGDIPQSLATGISKNGSVIVGYSGPSVITRKSTGFVWTQTEGMQSIKVFLESYGINVDGWSLSSVLSISDDGLVFIGGGTNPDGKFTTWIANLKDEPSNVTLITPNTTATYQPGDTVNLQWVTTGVTPATRWFSL